ncbi:MAG: gas vesicle protein K [Vicinamibacterales bacterium]
MTDPLVQDRSLKQGVLALVVALADILRETLERQAIRRMDAGDLSTEELDRLGEALMDLERALEQIKNDHGIGDAAHEVRVGLDHVVDDVVDRFLNPQRWVGEEHRAGR